MPAKRKFPRLETSGVTLGFRAKCWLTADNAKEYANPFSPGKHPELRGDNLMADQLFNGSGCFRKADELRWRFNAQIEIHESVTP